jgi:transcription elongation factor Elf1
LKLKRNHKIFVAAFLLALYAFIATPVSYWHHHKSTCVDDGTEQHSQVIKKNQSVDDANCKICSHHYSASINDAITIYFSPITIYSTFSDFYTVKKMANPGYGQSNKGPPSVG